MIQSKLSSKLISNSLDLVTGLLICSKKGSTSLFLLQQSKQQFFIKQSLALLRFSDLLEYLSLVVLFKQKFLLWTENSIVRGTNPNSAIEPVKMDTPKLAS